jgi:DNA-binding PadR family transcriptional regulator
MTPVRPTGYTLPRLVLPAALLIINGAGEAGIYGYQLKKQLLELPLTRRWPPDITGIYRVLRRLETQGFLASEVKPPEAGPARRVFRLTPAGTKYLQEWIEALEAWHFEVHRFMEAARSAGVTDIVLE